MKSTRWVSLTKVTRQVIMKMMILVNSFMKKVEDKENQATQVTSNNRNKTSYLARILNSFLV